MNRRRKRPQSIDSKVFARILGTGRGCVFTPGDFLHLGSRSAVYTALARGAKAGRIRKLAQGLYDYPRLGADGQPILPTTDAVVRALVGREGTRFQPSGAHAANMLGLTEQVPVRIVFLTDGKSRTVSIGRRTIVLKHATPRQMATADRKSGTVIQALRWLGKRSVDDSVISRVRRQLSPRERRELMKDVSRGPVWMTEILRAIARDERP
jgi:hypothetical protein